MESQIIQRTKIQILGDGVHKGLAAFWMLSKILIPVYLVMTILSHTPVLPWIANLCAPLMKFWGLPGEAATALVLGSTINIYACIAAIAALDLTAAQVTIIGVMIGVSHNHFMESAILHKTGTPLWIVVPLRIIVGLGLGWLVALGYRLAG